MVGYSLLAVHCWWFVAILVVRGYLCVVGCLAVCCLFAVGCLFVVFAVDIEEDKREFVAPCSRNALA